MKMISRQIVHTISIAFVSVCDTMKRVCVFSVIDTFGNVDKTGYYYLE